MHISELSADFVSDVNAVVSEGDAVSVRVLKIDQDKKQLSLSLKPEGAARGPPRDRKPKGGKKKAGAEELRKYVRRAGAPLMKSRRRRSRDVDSPRRRVAAAATWIVRGGESPRPRRG